MSEPADTTATAAAPVVLVGVADDLKSSIGTVADTAAAPPAPVQTAEGQAGGVRPPKPNVMTSAAGQLVAAPTTTEEEDRGTAGQRRVNIIWEVQQAVIASAVIGTGLYVSAKITLLVLDTDASDQQTAMAVTAFVLISNIVNLVIGFYFGRTNHQRIGGVQSGR